MKIMGLVLIILYLVNIFGASYDNDTRSLRVSAILGWGCSVVLALFYFIL